MAGNPRPRPRFAAVGGLTPQAYHLLRLPASPCGLRCEEPALDHAARSGFRAAKRRKIHSLGRQPQDHGTQQTPEPRSGDRQSEEDGCGSWSFSPNFVATAANVQPRSGDISIAWGVSPRNTVRKKSTSREAATDNEVP
jgi:hypothetical protein